jgi:hypothetical protein
MRDTSRSELGTSQVFYGILGLGACVVWFKTFLHAASLLVDISDACIARAK